MTRTPLLASLLLAVVVARLGTGAAAAQGRRVVDLVTVSDAKSEREHHLVGAATTLSGVGAERGRQATGWFSYDVRIYDDSPLTLVCVFRGVDPGGAAFDILVDGRPVAARAVERSTPGRADITVQVPEALSLGKTSVTVRFEARGGAPSPVLLELRTVQEHLE